MRRSGEEELSALRRQCEKAGVHELVERVRHWQGLARSERNARAAKRTHDLDCVERVSTRCLVHLGQERTREGNIELAHDGVKRTDVERADVDLDKAVTGEGSAELVDDRAVEPCAAREQNADRLAAQAPGRVGERTSGGRVQPLHVVDGDESRRRRVAERAQHAQDGNANCMCVRDRPLGLFEHECMRERGALAGGKRREHPVEHRIEQIAETGEAERGLALSRLCLQDA